MDRREFTKVVVSLPAIPSLPTQLEEDSGEDKEDFWEISSSWFRQYDHGDLLLIKNDEVQHRWRYEDYDKWMKATMLNSRFVADTGNRATNYVADLFDMSITSIYIDPPYFSVQFKSDSSEVHIQQGKYSESEYMYHVEYHDEVALRGVEDGADSIEKVVQEVSEFIF